MTPIAPTLETTSCWKPDSIHASARASWVDAVDAPPSGRSPPGSRHAAQAAPAAASRAPAGKHEPLTGHDDAASADAVPAGEQPRAHVVAGAMEKKLSPGRTTWTRTGARLASAR